MTISHLDPNISWEPKESSNLKVESAKYNHTYRRFALFEGATFIESCLLAIKNGGICVQRWTREDTDYSAEIRMFATPNREEIYYVLTDLKQRKIKAYSEGKRMDADDVWKNRLYFEAPDLTRRFLAPFFNGAMPAFIEWICPDKGLWTRSNERSELFLRRTYDQPLFSRYEDRVIFAAKTKIKQRDNTRFPSIGLIAKRRDVRDDAAQEIFVGMILDLNAAASVAADLNMRGDDMLRILEVDRLKSLKKTAERRELIQNSILLRSMKLQEINNLLDVGGKCIRERVSVQYDGQNDRNYLVFEPLHRMGIEPTIKNLIPRKRFEALGEMSGLTFNSLRGRIEVIAARATNTQLGEMLQIRTADNLLERCRLLVGAGRSADEPAPDLLFLERAVAHLQIVALQVWEQAIYRDLECASLEEIRNSFFKQIIPTDPELNNRLHLQYEATGNIKFQKIMTEDAEGRIIPVIEIEMLGDIPKGLLDKAGRFLRYYSPIKIIDFLTWMIGSRDNTNRPVAPREDELTRGIFSSLQQELSDAQMRNLVDALNRAHTNKISITMRIGTNREFFSLMIRPGR